ncbi:MAG: 30S ribosome-binding factor RbfA [Peptoniphilus sp.]|nr:30S ribosome-binding factor RbfA [Peptoniphilus sp.]
MNKKRVAQISEEVRRAVSDIIRFKLKDPRIPEIISISKAEVTNDLSFAKIYYSILDDESKKDDTQEALENAKGFIKRELSHAVKLRIMPELIFIYDDSLEINLKIDKLIKEVKNANRED